MASLDKMEGEAVEAVGFVLLVILVLIAYGFWKGVSGFKLPNFLQWLADFFKGLAGKINLPKVTGGSDWPTGDLNYSMPSPGELDGAGADWVSTGTNIGAEDLAAIGGS